jgi:hypothetical protein
MGPEVPYERGVILASDSQLFVQGDQPVDEGRAVYVLENNAALVFTGNVETGELAVAELLDYIANRRENTRVEMPKVTQHFFRRAAGEGGRRRRNPLTVLVGAYDAEPNDAQIVMLRQTDGFVPKRAQGVVVCGDEAIARAFGQALMAIDAERTGVSSAEDWQVDISTAMGLAMESAEEGYSIGGTVQTLRVDRTGMSQSGFSYTTADPFDSSTWPTAPQKKGPIRKQILAKVMD